MLLLQLLSIYSVIGLAVWMLDHNSHHKPPPPTFFENARTYFKPAEGWVSPRTVRLINTRASSDQSEAGLAHLWPIRGQYGGCCCACLPSARSIVPSKWKYPLEGLKAEYCTTLGGRALSLSLSLCSNTIIVTATFYFYSTKLCPVKAAAALSCPWLGVRLQKTVSSLCWDIVLHKYRIIIVIVRVLVFSINTYQWLQDQWHKYLVFCWHFSGWRKFFEPEKVLNHVLELEPHISHKHFLSIYAYML